MTEPTAVVTSETNNNEVKPEPDEIYPSSETETGSSADGSEYADSTDSSDEEDLRYTIGNIPMKWYEDLEHAGYNLDGKPIAKPVRQDQLDKLVTKIGNFYFWKWTRIFKIF